MLTKVERRSDNQTASDSFFLVLNALFDVHLPHLKDTEFKVLCVAFRQTWGRKDPQTGRRKERDWLSQNQLKKRTGRGGDAIAAAIDALVRKGLLIVESEDGTPLLTPPERRRHLSRLFYRLGPAILPSNEGESKDVEKEVEVVPGKVGQPVGKAGEEADIFGLSERESRVDKADTTKNKQNRSNSYKDGSERIFNKSGGVKGEELTGEMSLTEEQKASIEESRQRIRERLATIAPATKS